MEIIQNVSRKEWCRHCPGLQNQADLASLVAPGPALVMSQLWWNGQQWLSLEGEKWPDPPNLEQQDSLVQKDFKSESRGVCQHSCSHHSKPKNRLEPGMDLIMESAAKENRLDI
jgi:hypothetical protein